MIQKIRHFIGKRYNIIRYLLNEYNFLFRTLGSCDTTKCQNKEREQLIMSAHVIEKGLSLKDVRPGFGISKILKLLTHLDNYTNRYSDQETLAFALSVIDAYIEFHEDIGHEINAEIIQMHAKLSNKINANVDFKHLKGGIIHLSKEEVLQSLNGGFEAFAKSRHSLRQFTGGQIEKARIEKAFQIAETTPSACNRQPWHNFVFMDKTNIVKILEIQHGARQFKDDVAALVIVTSTPNAFYGQEFHQHLVNGGLYAMNLLYALHSLGLGAIPLNGGISHEQQKQILDICNSDGNDDLIMLIAVGQMPNEFSVAKSARIQYSKYTKFDI